MSAQIHPKPADCTDAVVSKRRKRRRFKRSSLNFVQLSVARSLASEATLSSNARCALLLKFHGTLFGCGEPLPLPLPPEQQQGKRKVFLNRAASLDLATTPHIQHFFFIKSFLAVPPIPSSSAALSLHFAFCSRMFYF